MADSYQPLFFPEDLTAQSGDLIFREGTEPISELVMTVDDGGYSHVGMLYKQKDQWYVIHATPSEKIGIPDSVVIDELSFYLNKNNAKSYAIYKVKATEQQHRQAVNYTYQQLGVLFDITGKTGTYCTLLILDAWKTADIDLQVSYTLINLPFVRGNYLLPKDLRASTKLKEIYKSTVKD